jgi:CRISPR-associated protein Csb2
LLVLEVRFLTGRYHATPWDRHANEGAVEWPPSSWRLMRALVSSWKRTCHEVRGEEVQSLLSRLAGAAPAYCLPPSTQAHVRHYVPVGEERRILLDAFVVVDRAAPVAFVWPSLELEGEEETLLDELLRGVGYLGRSQSWCGIRRASSHGPLNATPYAGEESWSLARVLSPLPQVTVEQMTVTTQTLRHQGHNRPPGSRWVTYLLDQAWERPALATGLPTCAVYMLAKPISKALTLGLADRVRRALNGLAPGSATFLGKGPAGARKDGHQHLHILPDGEGEALTRAILWAPEGFGEEEQAALRRLSALPAAEGQEPARLVLDYVGEEEANPLLCTARVWHSYTPYLPPRHGKKDGRESAVEQVVKECERRGLPVPEVTMLGSDGLTYQLHRGPRPGPGAPPEWLHLTFPEPVSGPLCLGAQAHFGMGRFVPAE